MSVLDKPLSEKTMQGMKKNGAKLRKGALRPTKKEPSTSYGVATHEAPPAKNPRTKDRPKPPVRNTEVTVQVVEALTVEEAMTLIGWEVVEDGPFHLRDPHGAKILLRNNSTNRPFRMGLANRYKSEFLRDKWKLNGETIIFDDQGKCASGQHRLAGFIMAEIERREDKKPPNRKDGVGWKELCKVYWKRGGPLTMPCIIVKGISSAPEVIDTIDQGQKRTVGDVFFREERFSNALLPQQVGPVSVGKNGPGSQVAPPISEKVRQKLCNILAGATRLVWLRAGGKSVADAPHFPLSEAVDFINAHPKLEEFVVYVWGLEGGSGKGGCHISRFTTLAYAAGLCYLMASSGTEPDEFMESGVAALDFGNEKKAKEFWAKVASGAKLEEDDPIHQLRQMLPTLEQSSGTGRDEVVGMIIQAFSLWMDKKKASAKDLAMPRDSAGKLTKAPRLGGMDVEGPERVEPLDVETAEDTREGKMHGSMWAEGDTCWVRDSEQGEHWFGTIDEVIKRPLKEGGELCHAN